MSNVNGTRAQAGSQRLPGSGQALTVLLTAVAYFMVMLDALVVVTALPSIHRSLGGGIGTLQWTVSAYTIAFGAGILTAAALGDRVGGAVSTWPAWRCSPPPRPPARSRRPQAPSLPAGRSRGWALRAWCPWA